MKHYKATTTGGRLFKQSGAFMLELSLALIITAIAAAGAMRENIRAGRMELANVQADALSTYAAALEKYTAENYANLQSNLPVTVNAVTLAPGSAAGESLRPTVANLQAMNYLPPGFSNFTIMVDGGAFDNIIDRTPAACVATACSLKGLAYINRPIVVPNTVFEDGPALGQMIARLGGVAAVSSSVNPATMTSAGGTLTIANPVATNPAGLIGVRFADGASNTSQFLRVADARDPNFQGNFTLAGNAGLAGTLNVAGATTLNETVTVKNGAMDCVSIDKTGVISITCTGRLNATTGEFTSGGQTVTIDPVTGVVATGRVTGANGLATNSATLFDAADPNSITVNAGDLFIKDGVGATMVRFQGGNVIASGNVSAGGSVSATSEVSGSKMSLKGVVAEGSACTVAGASDIAALADGGISSCVNGTWRAVQRFSDVNAACAVPGGVAVDRVSGVGLLCRSGFWMSSNELSSRFVLMATFGADNGTVVNKPTCPGPVGVATPLVILVPFSDTPAYTAGMLDGTNRSASDNGTFWTVNITTSSGGAAAGSSVIAHTYCYYSSL